MGDWVSRNFGDHIRQVLHGAGTRVSRVEFSVPRIRPKVAAKPKPTVAAPAQPAPDARSEGELPGAALDPRFTFDSFVVGKPNELAHAAARRVANGGVVTFNPLFLYGGVGLGKTHLAISLAIKACHHGFKVYFTTMDTLMRKLNETQSKRKAYLTSSLVVVDEVTTGLGRTGKLLAEEHEGIEADLTAFADQADALQLAREEVLATYRLNSS